MKTIFRLLLICLFVSIASESHAQKQMKKLTSDLHVGFNFAKMDVSGGYGNEYNTPKVGMSLGMNVNYKIYGNIQVQTGFFVTKKGLKQDIKIAETTTVNDVIVTNRLNHAVGNYMQVPLCLGYEVYLTDQLAININAGAYFAYGYKGTYENKFYEEIISPEGSVVTNPTETHAGETFDLKGWRRFDYGTIGRIGVVYDIFMLTFNYEYGLRDISADNALILKNRTPTIALGFRF